MVVRKYLLPPNLDPPARRAALEDLVRNRWRRGLATLGYILDCYPFERGWVVQPGNADPKRRVFYGVLTSRATISQRRLMRRAMREGVHL